MSATWQIVWSHGLLNIYAMYLKEVEMEYAWPYVVRRRHGATAAAAACCLRDRKNARCHRKTTFSLAASRRRPAAAAARASMLALWLQWADTYLYDGVAILRISHDLTFGHSNMWAAETWFELLHNIRNSYTTFILAYLVIFRWLIKNIYTIP